MARWLGPTSRPFARELRAAFGEGCSVAELGLSRSDAGVDVVVQVWPVER